MKRLYDGQLAGPHQGARGNVATTISRMKSTAAIAAQLSKERRAGRAWALDLGFAMGRDSLSSDAGDLGGIFYFPIPI
jgi:hypothetical protein